jgi:hypothetical protein
MTVRVTFVRGLRRVVGRVGSSSEGSMDLVSLGLDSLDVGLDVVSLPDVLDVPNVVVDVGGSSGPPISVVWGGLVLVMVWVVVAVLDWDAVAENVGSTKSSGACVGSLT